MSELQAVVFNLNGMSLGADTVQIQEIVQYKDVDRLSEMPEYIDGFINMRGKPVAVVNLNKRFNTGEAPVTRKTKVIITGVNEINIGYMVDEVSEIIKFREENIDPPPEVLSRLGNNYVKCVGKKDEELLIILDLSRVLTEKEIRRLE